eukprot:CAMPEP_0117758484 /NCGR_PEP_ID=MMETSP0947-20121206/15410_1 /TAXON_ID=44440 /ORGANISM="Chattonella subsalsa, Strain CCMP2191" /LENGTH=250 /DNA_ID=CAMNT_0005578689 /DNA_START=48 /DNA_END=800 /DNA_ORIENTATION=+
MSYISKIFFSCLLIATSIAVATAFGNGRQIFQASEAFINQPNLARPLSCNKKLYSQQAASISMEADLSSLMKDAETRMSKSLESLKENLNTIRTGRASPAILDRVMVEYYGTETPLNQLASISTSSSTQLVVDPYDKSALADVERAIMESGVGLTPNNDGNVIRLNIPALTEERRKELSKEAKALGEEAKVAVRNIRRDVVDKVKKSEKAKELSKDESKDGQDDAQKLTDKYVKQADEIVSKKETDIMTL